MWTLGHHKYCCSPRPWPEESHTVVGCGCEARNVGREHLRYADHVPPHRQPAPHASTALRPLAPTHSAATQRVACLIKPRDRAGPQHCTHSEARLFSCRTSVGIVPVSELSLSFLQHIERRHRGRRAPPEAWSERHARAQRIRLQPPLGRHGERATTDQEQALKAGSMLTEACQWHPGAAARSASTTCAAPTRQ